MAIFYPHARATINCVFDGFTQDGTDSHIFTIHVIPKTCQVTLNGYRMASTFDVSFDAKLLPFSPELLRAASVEIFLFQTQGLIPDQSLVINGPPTIAGLVDDAELSVGSDGAWFTLTGRDYTGLLLDKPWPGGPHTADGKPIKGKDGFPVSYSSKFPTDKPIDVAIQSVIDRVLKQGDHKETLTVKLIGDGDISSAKNLAATTTKKRVTIKPVTGHAHSRTAKAGLPQPSGRSYWDVIYSVCQQHGFICYIQGTDLIITTPQTSFEDAANSSYFMAYGRNLESLRATRHLGREQVPQIQVFSYDPDTKRVITAVYPKDPPKKVSGLSSVKESVKFIDVTGIKDPKRLTEIAQTYYNQISKAEVKIFFETKDLTDLKGMDLLPTLKNGNITHGIHPGKAIMIHFDAVNKEQLKDLKGPQIVAKMLSLGYSEQVSNLVALEADHIKQFELPFYIRDLHFTWDSAAGISIGGEAMKFVFEDRDGNEKGSKGK